MIKKSDLQLIVDNLEDPDTRKPCEMSSSTLKIAMDYDISLDKSTITSMTMGDVEYLLGRSTCLEVEALYCKGGRN